MSELDVPESWAIITLPDLVKLQNGQTPKNLPVQCENGNIPFFKVSDMNSPGDGRSISKAAIMLSQSDVERLKIRLVEERSVIFPKNGGALLTNKKRFTVRTSALDTNLMAAIPPKELFEYFWAWFQTVDFKRYSSGSTVPMISFNDIKGITVPIPPIAEQRRIVSKIDSTFKRIEAIEKAAEAAEALLTVYRESLLNKAFRGELVAQDPNDEPALKLLERIRADRPKQQDGKKKAALPAISEDEIPFDIPNSWKWVRLGELASDIRYGTSKRCSVEHLNTAVLRIPNIVNGRINIDDLKYANFDKKERDDLRLQDGDILMIRSNGSLKLVGKTAVVDETIEGYAFAGYLIRIRLQASLAVPQFVSSYMDSSFCRNIIERQAQSTSGINNFSAEKLVNLMLPLPPLQEQRRILATINLKNPVVDQSRSVCENIRNRCQNMRSSVLGLAFSGGLVPQISSEGTGQDLLKAILAAKTNANNSGRARRQK